VYNCIKYALSVSCQTSEMLTHWQNTFGIDYHDFGNPMSKMIEKYLFGDQLMKFTPSYLIFGYTSKIVEKINGGDFLWGNDFALEGFVTPVFND